MQITTRPAASPSPTGLTGPVFRPGDPGYAEEVAGFQTGYVHRPDLVVGAADAEDVRRTVRYAARHGLPVAVQATGHGRSVPAEGGVLISTRRMARVAVDPAARTVRFGAGARWGAVVEAAARHGLAPLNGSAPSVGAVGYHLGGGIGLLARRYGYAADHVRAVELVTADGRRRRTVPGDDLFAAVLGTDGNFGVVTAMETALFPVRTVYGGQLAFDTALAGEVLETWRTWTAGVPEELTSAVTLIPFPDLPELPAPLRGRYVATVRIAFEGSAEEGERLVAPLRAVGARISDDLREMPYRDSAAIHRDPEEPHAYAAVGAMLRELPARGVRAMLAAAGPDSPVPCVLSVRHLGGALRRPGPAGIAVDHRDAEFLVQAISEYRPEGAGGGGDAATRARHGLLCAALAPWTLGQNPNFLYGDGPYADERRVRELYAPLTHKRLTALKAVHDPANMFRFNRNLRPE
ncbi:FAD-binding oxidoreductase [Streptomyces huiliensis]|uniref:FAD-binding oxidoreductase n=1 Tax=Streptomyces huiliensis TaxID=2876027 RepID=UPI001CC14534|nr:FAD-binding oxidoreductase [Streptomyces huiliensis]MBZ4321838.1 FAD-binding oxidoreductase [Streptomyces huiliensis]